MSFTETLRVKRLTVLGAVVAMMLITGGGYLHQQQRQSEKRQQAMNALLKGCKSCDERKASRKHFRDWLATQSPQKPSGEE